MAYLTKDDVTAFLNITGLSVGAQSSLTAIIEAIEAFTDSYCNRTWNTRDGIQNPIVFTEVFDGNTGVFFPKNPPIKDIVTVTIDGDTLSLDDAYNYGSLIRLSSLASAGRQIVSITYTSNATLPADVKHALVRWAGEIFKSAEDAGKTTKRVQWGNQVDVEFLTQDGIPTFVQMVLDRYRLHAL